MAAAKFDFVDQHRVEQGTDSTRTFIWKDTQGNPVPLAGWTGAMQVRPSKRSDQVLLSLTSANGGISLGASDGTISITFKDEDTTGASWVSGVYDLKLTDTSGSILRFMEGDLELSIQVTHE